MSLSFWGFPLHLATSFDVKSDYPAGSRVVFIDSRQGVKRIVPE